MGANSAKSGPALGFLTVLDHPQHGLFGGYLVLNTAGRPMEFHCTAPIKPNRAQEILYGPTLEPFLYGEQIGQTLLGKAQRRPFLVCTDRRAALAVREHVSLPVVLVLPVDRPPIDPDNSVRRIAPARSDGHNLGGPDLDGSGLVKLKHGQNCLAVPEQCEDDRRLIAERLAQLPDSFDLAEPFGRIRDAIEEARQAVRSP